MIALLSLFANNLLPTFLIAGAGFLLGKRLLVSPRTISQIVFYIFSPCLVFNLLTINQLASNDIIKMFTFATLIVAATGLLAWLGGSFLKLDRRMRAAVMLTSMFNNAGNLGLPITLFAFKESALAYATLYFITNASLTYTVGIVIASSGSSSLKQALIGFLKLPMIYALFLAAIFIQQGWQLWEPVDKALTLLSQAAIPAMLVLLGLQLSEVNWAGQVKALTLTSSIRLLAAPAIAFMIAPLLDLQGAAYQAGILESAMPSAVLTTILATEFDVEPSFVTGAVFITTLISPLTLTPLLSLLGT